MSKKMKKTSLIIVSALLSACLLAGCQTNETVDELNPEPVPTPEETVVEVEEPHVATPKEILAEILAQIPFPSPVERDETERHFGEFYRIDTTDLQAASFVNSGAGYQPDEVAVFKFSSPESAEAAVVVLKRHLERRTVTFSEYASPEDMRKLYDGVVMSRGDYAFYIVNADSSKTKEIVEQLTNN
ncbi:MAG: DUF4358 domain-containing protein [Oscillospiraceae bacterium]|nr:DUF4358 domain-containing protein [Oscillospiraceae bacterium]